MTTRSDGSLAAARAIAAPWASGQGSSSIGAVSRPASMPAPSAPATAAHTSNGCSRERAGDSGDHAANAAGSSTTAAYGSQTTLRSASRPTSTSAARHRLSNRRSRISGRRIATIATAANAKKSGPNHPRSVVAPHSLTMLRSASFVSVPR